MIYYRVDNMLGRLYSHAQAPVFSNDTCDEWHSIPLARDGLQILRTPIGAPVYCKAQICRTITFIRNKPDLLSTFDHQHEQLSHCVFALGHTS